MRGLVVVAFAMLAACGRIRFDGVSDTGDASLDDTVSSSDNCLATKCPAGVPFCDDFEMTQAPGFAPWDVVAVQDYLGQPAMPGTEFAIEASPACGARVLAAHVMGDGQFAQLLEEITPRPTTSYVRTMMYVPLGNASPDVDTFGIGDLTARYTLVQVRSTGQIGVHSSESNNVPSTGPGVFELGRWNCVEIEITYGAPGHYRLWNNDALVIDVDETTQTTGADLGWALVGVAITTNVGLTTVYFDDVAVSSSRIGCS